LLPTGYQDTPGERSPGVSRLPSHGPVTVFDDGAADVLTGSAGIDWFFANLDGDGDPSVTKDKITDLHALEFADDLDFIQGP
jgi:hypothetical protein